jgi:hypothetical protein
MTGLGPIPQHGFTKSDGPISLHSTEVKMDDNWKKVRAEFSPLHDGISQKSNAKTKLIAKQIEVLLSGFRRDDCADPDLFYAQLGAILEDYSESVIIYVTSPKTGVQRSCKYTSPSIAEVVAACERAKVILDSNSRWKAIAMETLKRREGERNPPPGPPGETMHAKLCRKYNLRDIPRGLDAIDIVRLAHQHGDGLQAHFDKEL